MEKLKSKKYIALIGIIFIILMIIGINKIGNIDFNQGKVKIKSATISNIKSSLSANINEANVENAVTSKGYDEINYEITYTLSTDEAIDKRDVMLHAFLVY